MIQQFSNFVNKIFFHKSLAFSPGINHHSPMGLIATNSKSKEDKDQFSPASTFMELIEYDADAQTMDITFKSGSKIRYIEVYPSTFLSFKQSPTHNSYYSRAIKGNLQSVKIVDKSIGTEQSTPLKKVSREENLDRGLKSQQSRAKRITGTVQRAIDAAGVVA